MKTRSLFGRRAFRLAAWLVATVVAATYLVQSLRIEPDIGRFISVDRSAPGSALSSLQQGPAGRLVIIAISGGSPAVLAAASRTLTERLVESDQFAAVQNGDLNQLRRDVESLLPYRYLLSSRWVDSRLDADYLHRHLLAAVPLLQGSVGWLVAELLPADPTLESLEVGRQWSTGTGLPTVDGVWLSADRSHAVILAVSRAEGGDAAGQRAVAATVATAAATVGTASNDKLKVEYSGLGVLSAKARDITRARVDRLGWISAGAVLLILVVGYRRLLPVVITAVPALLGIGAGLVITMAMFGSINLLSLAFASILLGEAVDYPCYLLTQARSGMPIAHEARAVWPTLRLAVATSVASLTVLLLADFEGLKQLGLLCGVALSVAGLATRWLIPELVGPNYEITWKPLAFPGPPKPSGPLEGHSRDSWTALGTVGRWLGFLAPVAAVAVLALASPLWDDRAAAINPLPIEDIAKDQRLRTLAGISRTPSFLVMRADSPQRILEAQEAIAAKLGATNDDSSAGARIDFAARFVPSESTQARRRAALPERTTLERAVATAAATTPFNAAAFNAFLDAVDQSRRLSLDIGALPSRVLALRVESLLFRSDGHWLGLVSAPDAAARAAVSAVVDRVPPDQRIDGQWVEPASTLTTVIERARKRLVILLGVALVVTYGVIAAATRSPISTFCILRPVAVALAISAAVIHSAFGPLTVFNILSLLLVLGISTNYSLFVHQGSPDRSTAWDRRTMFSLTMTSSTTLAVFGALAVSGIAVVESIGRTVVVGIVVSLAWILFDWWTARR